MFGKKENSIVSTHLIVKVRKYHNLKPSFYLESTIADDTEANSVVEKLNDIAEIQKEDNVQEQYYSVHFNL